MGFKKRVQENRNEVKELIISINNMVDLYDLGFRSVIESTFDEDKKIDNLSVLLLAHFVENAQSFEELGELRTFVSKPILNKVYSYCVKKVAELDEIERLAEIEHKNFENSHQKEL